MLVSNYKIYLQFLIKFFDFSNLLCHLCLNFSSSPGNAGDTKILIYNQTQVNCGSNFEVMFMLRATPGTLASQSKNNKNNNIEEKIGMIEEDLSEDWRSPKY